MRTGLWGAEGAAKNTTLYTMGRSGDGWRGPPRPRGLPSSDNATAHFRVASTLSARIATTSYAIYKSVVHWKGRRPDKLGRMAITSCVF